MPKYEVTMNITRKLDKPISVYADDEAEAEEKAVDIVNGWDNVDDCEAVEVEEV